MKFLDYQWSLILFLESLLLVAHVQGQGCGTSRRRAWRDLTCQEQNQYLDAVQSLKNSGLYDEFVVVHFDSAEFAHFVPEFLVWHRWFLWVFEQQLQRVSGTCLSLPYWDWERGDTLPIILKESTFGTNNGGGCVDNGIARRWRTASEDGCLNRVFDNSARFSRDTEVLSRITNNANFREFTDALEGAPHSLVHEYIGGLMRRNWSVDDPLFWLHHTNIDRIYTLWQDYRGHDEVDVFESQHYSGRMDDALVFITRRARRVNFDYRARGRPPTPRELLSNVDGPLLDVQYVNDSLARMLMETSNRYRNSGNNLRWIVPANGQVLERCREESGNQQEEEPERNEPEWVEQEEEEEEEQPRDEESNWTESSCLSVRSRCGNSDDCCSGFCSPQSRCATVCGGRGVGCRFGEDCCSGRCDQGRCSSRTRRLAGPKIGFDSMSLDFSSEIVASRWVELISVYSDDEAALWATLAKEDCDRSSPGIPSRMLEWIEEKGLQNKTHTFTCHDILHKQHL